MGYSAIVSIALFILLARNAERFRVAVLAGLAVGLPFLFSSILFWILNGFDAVLLNIIQPLPLIIVAAQYIIAVIVFRFIKEIGDENLTTYFAWVAVSWPLIFLFVPWLIGQIG